MVKHYKPKHQLVKKLPKDFQEIADSFIDHIGKLMDNTSSRDLIYILTFTFGLWYVYNELCLLKHIAEKIVENPFSMLFGLAGLVLPTRKRRSILTEAIIETETEKGQVDLIILAQAMLITYGLMKIDIGDVASGLTKITSAIGTMGI